jgi:hypothetical protein
VKTLESIAQPLSALASPARLARIYGLGWSLMHGNEAQLMWVDPVRRLAVMEGIESHGGERWHHVSMSHAVRVPTWPELSEAKVRFIGDDVEAYLVHPPAERYINIDSRVLHWYASIERPRGVLPDFRSESPGLRGGRVVGI